MIIREPAEAYHARKAVSAGLLWDLVNECPAYAYARSVFNPDPLPPQHNHELDIGTAAHLAVLESSEFAARCSLIAADDYRTKEAREIRDQCYIDGKTPLLPRQYELVNTLRDALRKSDAAELLFGPGDSEVSFTWSEPDIAWQTPDILCKARADRITPHEIGDLKTAVSASPAAFQRAMTWYGHHLRAAWYQDGLLKAGADHTRDYLFIVIAKWPPPLVAVYRIDEQSLEWGRRLYRRGLQIFRECQETGIWPGYAGKGEKVTTLGLPAYKEYQYGDLEDQGEL